VGLNSKLEFLRQNTVGDTVDPTPIQFDGLYRVAASNDAQNSFHVVRTDATGQEFIHPCGINKGLPYIDFDLGTGIGAQAVFSGDARAVYRSFRYVSRLSGITRLGSTPGLFQDHLVDASFGPTERQRNYVGTEHPHVQQLEAEQTSTTSGNTRNFITGSHYLALNTGRVIGRATFHGPLALAFLASWNNAMLESESDAGNGGTRTASFDAILGHREIDPVLKGYTITTGGNRPTLWNIYNNLNLNDDRIFAQIEGITFNRITSTTLVVGTDVSEATTQSNAGHIAMNGRRIDQLADVQHNIYRRQQQLGALTKMLQDETNRLAINQENLAKRVNDLEVKQACDQIQNLQADVVQILLNPVETLKNVGTIVNQGDAQDVYSCLVETIGNLSLPIPPVLP
jgi:uncharacterized coiled-coil protein SlyX